MSGGAGGEGTRKVREAAGTVSRTAAGAAGAVGTVARRVVPRRLALPRLGPRLDVRLLRQATPVLLLCGLGLLLAGGLLERLRTAEAFVRLPALFVLVPVLLGLKGNVELTLASRLGSAWHLGQLSEPQRRRQLLIANLGVVELQAITVGLAASAIALLQAVLTGETPTAAAAWSLVATATVTAAVAGAFLAVFTFVLVQASASRGLNPDNVGGPLVASVGDLVALLLLAGIATALVATDASLWLSVALVVLAIAALVPAFLVARADRSTQRVLREGWTPILIALALTSTAGIVLEHAIERHHGVAFLLLLPMLNGVGGNLAGIHGSRTCTALHEGSRDPARASQRSLLLLVLPLQATLLLLAWPLASLLGLSPLSGGLTAVFLLAAVLQVSLLLPVGGMLARRAWRRGRDPDNQVMPYVTALADVGGTSLLVLGLTLLAI